MKIKTTLGKYLTQCFVNNSESVMCPLRCNNTICKIRIGTNPVPCGFYFDEEMKLSWSFTALMTFQACLAGGTLFPDMKIMKCREC